MVKAEEVAIEVQSPMVFHLRGHIPHLFSIGLPEDFKRVFSQFISLANDLESKNKKSMLCFYQPDPTRFSETVLIKITELELAAKKLIAHAQQLERNEHWFKWSFRISMLLYVVKKYNGDTEFAIKKKINYCKHFRQQELRMKSYIGIKRICYCKPIAY